MDNSTAQSPTPPGPEASPGSSPTPVTLFPPPRQGTLYFLQIVITVAFILATLFTAWTPASLLPGSLTEKLAQVMAPLSGTPTAVFPTPTPRPRPHIGIVAGHWGNDSGAVCSDGFTEAEINLKIANKVQADLIAQGYDVEVLKEFDPNLSGYRALALVSIHADSCDYINDLATGFKVAAALNNPNPEMTARLTACLRNRYEARTGLPFHANSVTPDMTSYHAFDEIQEDTIAAIIEVGFMNLDRQILTNGQDKVSGGITDGILCFINNENIATPIAP